MSINGDSNGNVDIICNADSSCSNLTIDGYESYNISLYCNYLYCKDITFECKDYANCFIYCGTGDSCQNVELICRGSNANCTVYSDETTSGNNIQSTLLCSNQISNQECEVSGNGAFDWVQSYN